MGNVMNLIQNNHFGCVYGEYIDQIINKCNLAKNVDIVKDENTEKLIAFVYEKGYSDGRLCYMCDLEKIIKNHPDL